MGYTIFRRSHSLNPKIMENVIGKQFIIYLESDLDSEIGVGDWYMICIYSIYNIYNIYSIIYIIYIYTIYIYIYNMCMYLYMYIFTMYVYYMSIDHLPIKLVGCAGKPQPRF